MGDDGPAVKKIVMLLYEKNYLNSSKGSDYDRKVYEAVLAFQREHGLEENGMMDDETLSLLIWGTASEAMSHEEVTEVWIPTDGGKKRHRTQTCSNMYDPRKLSSRNAEALGMEACKRCKPQ